MESAVVVKADYYLQAEQYSAVKEAWKQLSEGREITSGDIIIYNILRGVSPSRGFIERKTNIQGNDAWYAFITAKSRARLTIGKADIFFKRFGIIPPAGLDNLVRYSDHE